MITDNDASTRPAQRVEVFTGTGRRRAWLDEDKVRIVAEIASSGDSVCAVARRHGFVAAAIRSAGGADYGDAEAASAESGGLEFVPAVVEAGSASAVASRSKLRLKAEIAGTIEVEIEGVKIRIRRGVDAATLTMGLRALKVGA